MPETCNAPAPTTAAEALAWVASALRSERVLRSLQRNEVGLERED
jgi:hypothetical protein